MNEEEFNWCIEQTLHSFGEDREPLNMILDDGGDLNEYGIRPIPRISCWNQRIIRRNHHRGTPF